MRSACALAVLLIASSCGGGLPARTAGIQSPQPRLPSTITLPPPWTPTAPRDQPQPSATTELPASPSTNPSGAEAATGPTRTEDTPTEVALSDLRALDMVSSTRGWAVASTDPGSIWRTVDGGFTWTDVTPPQPLAEYLERGDTYPSTFLLDAFQGWAIFPGQDMPVWRTADGGRTWQRTSQTLSAPHFSLFFSDPSHGWLFSIWGAATMDQWPKDLYATVDGGLTWELMVGGHETVLTPATRGWVFLDSMFGWIATSIPDSRPSSLLVTHDAGITWRQITVPPPSQAPNLFDESATTCSRFELRSPTLFGPARGSFTLSCEGAMTDPQRPSPPNYLYRTMDDGLSWITAEVPGTDVVFVREDSAWTSTQTPTGMDIFHSTDLGATWSRVKSTEWQGSIEFVSDVTAFALVHPPGEDFDPRDIRLVRSVDGCRSWQIVEPVFLTQTGDPTPTAWPVDS